MKKANTSRFSSYLFGLGYFYGAGFACCANREDNAKRGSLFSRMP